MKSSEKQHLAKSLFIKSDLNRKEIAKQVGVTEKTLRDWIQKFNWEELKISQTITREQLYEQELKQLAALNKQIEDQGGVPNKQQSDAKAVIRKNIEALSHTPLYKYIEAFDDFSDWLIKNHPGDLKLMAERSYEFLEELAKKKR